MKKVLKIIFLVYLGLLSFRQVQASPKITKLLTRIRNLPTSEKIQETSKFFLGKRTSIGPLGEGKRGKFDSDPLYSFKSFDCTTYIETVMALALSQDLEDFKRNMTAIRYRDGIVTHLTRNHFISLDWIPNNSKILSDVTASIGPTKKALAMINKNSWYQKMGPANISRPDVTGPSFKNLLNEFRNLGKDISPKKATLPYISLKEILNNPHTLKSIPHGAIINIVRPNWDLTDTIGTHLNVSHQGLAIWKRGKLYYRHASSFPDKRVKDTPFKIYFSKYLSSESLKGINIQELN